MLTKPIRFASVGMFLMLLLLLGSMTISPAASSPLFTPTPTSSLSTLSRVRHQVIETDNPQVLHNGVWMREQDSRASGGLYVVSEGNSYDAMQFRFEGNRVDIGYFTSPDYGTLVIEIDNTIVRTIITQDYTVGLQWAVIDYLESGHHLLEIYASAGVIGIDAFRIYTAQDLSIMPLSVEEPSDLYNQMVYICDDDNGIYLCLNNNPTNAIFSLSAAHANATVHSPTWSPTQQQIVYVVTENNVSHLWTVTKDAQGVWGNPIQYMTTGDVIRPYIAEQIRWSPDGTKIAFARHAGTPTVPTNSRIFYLELADCDENYQCPITQLTNDVNFIYQPPTEEVVPSHNDYAPVWLSNEILLFSATYTIRVEEIPPPIGGLDFVLWFGFYEIDLHGNLSIRGGAETWSPVWFDRIQHTDLSPDRNMLLFSSVQTTHNNMIRTFDLLTQTIDPPFPGYGTFGGLTFGRFPSWLPDGNHFVFEGQNLGVSEVYLADLSVPTLDTEELAPGTSPHWYRQSNPPSPDGEIVYLCDVDDGTTYNDVCLWTKDTSTSIVIASHPADSITVLSPIWSPDGNRIAYAITDDGTRIEILDRASNWLPVTKTISSSTSHLDWKPDGTMIVYSSNTSGNNRLHYVTDLSNSCLSDCEKNFYIAYPQPAEGLFPIWRNDNAIIAYSNTGGGWNVYLYSAGPNFGEYQLSS